MNIEKCCTRCLQNKPIESFRRQAKTRDGRKYICKICDNEINHARYLLKSSQIKSQVKTWQANNPEKTKQYKQKYKRPKHEKRPIAPNPPEGQTERLS